MGLEVSKWKQQNNERAHSRAKIVCARAPLLELHKGWSICLIARDPQREAFYYYTLGDDFQRQWYYNGQKSVLSTYKAV